MSWRCLELKCCKQFDVVRLWGQTLGPLFVYGRGRRRRRARLPEVSLGRCGLCFGVHLGRRPANATKTNLGCLKFAATPDMAIPLIVINRNWLLLDLMNKYQRHEADIEMGASFASISWFNLCFFNDHSGKQTVSHHNHQFGCINLKSTHEGYPCQEGNFEATQWSYFVSVAELRWNPFNLKLDRSIWLALRQSGCNFCSRIFPNVAPEMFICVNEWMSEYHLR